MVYMISRQDCEASGVPAAFILFLLRQETFPGAPVRQVKKDGRIWVPYTVNTFVKMLPGYSDRQVRAALKTLLDSKVIEREYLGLKKWDRTPYYSLTLP